MKAKTKRNTDIRYEIHLRNIKKRKQEDNQISGYGT